MSGLNQAFAKRSYAQKVYRGFESRPLRKWPSGPFAPSMTGAARGAPSNFRGPELEAPPREETVPVSLRFCAFTSAVLGEAGLHAAPPQSRGTLDSR